MADDLDWDDLRYFLAAVRAKTLAGAARALGVEHTTIGRRLTSLERALGAPLVLRGPEGLQLTSLGEKVAPLVAEIERAVVAVRDLVASHSARVRLAVPTGFTKLFAARLPELRARHPGLELEIMSGARTMDLKRGEADLAIRSGPVTDKDLVVRKLCPSGWSVYAAPSYFARRPQPVDLRDLGGHDVIGYDPTLASVPAAKWIEDSQATVVLRSREMTDMVSAALSGVGLAVLPCFLGDSEPGLRRLTSEVVATRNLSLVYRREARLSPNVRAVAKFVVDVIHEHAARISGLR